jgi:hypothetical protein
MAINDKVIEVNKFGVGSLQTDLTDIWSGADGTGSQIIAKPLPLNTGELLYVSSTSANDVDQGTGAWKIILSGQDAQGLLQQEEIILNGQTQVETTKRYRRVCRAWVSAAASDTGQDGKIYIGRQGATGGVPDTPEDNVFAIIADEVLTGQDFSANQTQMACYTVPVGYEAKMYEIRCAAEASGADIIFYIRTKDSYDDNAVWRVRENIYTGSTGVGRRTYAVNARFTEGTDIQISGSASTNDQEASASFDLIVERVRDVAANMAGDLTVSDLTATGFKVSWLDVENDNFSDGFEITITATGFEEVYSVSKGVLEFVFDGLTEGTEYTVEVRNTWGEALSNALTATATPGGGGGSGLLPATGFFSFAGNSSSVGYVEGGSLTEVNVGLDANFSTLATDGTTIRAYGYDNVGSAGNFHIKSTDSKNWSEESFSGFDPAGFWYVGDKWFASDESGNQKYSLDGETWLDTNLANPFVKVVYNGTLYAAIAGGVFYSADGITWSEASDTGSFASPPYIITAINGYFILFGEGGAVASGTDGDVYTDRVSQISGDVDGGGSAVAGGGVAIFAGLSADFSVGQHQYTTDGVTFTSFNPPAGKVILWNPGYSNADNTWYAGTFEAGASNPGWATSSDGITWTNEGSTTDLPFGWV